MKVEDNDLRRLGRREFMTLCAGLITAMSFDGLSGSAISHAAEIKFPEGRCGEKTNMSKKVLVAYASKYGSTGGVADAIGRELCGRGAAVDVSLIRNAVDIGSYQGVVVGSAIYMGRWMSEAAEFVKKNREILSRVPVAYFLVCMTLRQPTDQNRAKVLSYLDPVLKAVPEVKPVDIGAFAGALDYKNLSWMNRKIMESKGSQEGDFRDWNAIHAWAKEPVGSKLVR